MKIFDYVMIVLLVFIVVSTALLIGSGSNSNSKHTERQPGSGHISCAYSMLQVVSCNFSSIKKDENTYTVRCTDNSLNVVPVDKCLVEYY